MSYVGTKPGATVPPAAGMVKSDGVVLQTAVPNTDYLPAANPTFTGNLTAGGLGTGQRIRGDFSNATVANRAMFQTVTVNGNTLVEAIPNGTGATGSFRANNSSDPSNGSVTMLSISATESIIAASKYGTGAYLPLSFQAGGAERMRIDPTTGNVGIGVTPLAKLHVYNGAASAPNLEMARLSYTVTNDGDGAAINFTNASNTNLGRISINYSASNNGNGMGFWTQHNGLGFVKNLEISPDGITTGKNIIAQMAKQVPRVDATGDLGGVYAGKCIAASSSVNISGGAFSSGDVFTIFNTNNAANITVTTSNGAALRGAGFTTSGTRTLAPYGMMTVWAYNSTDYYFTGSGIS